MEETSANKNLVESMGEKIDDYELINIRTDGKRQSRSCFQKLWQNSTARDICSAVESDIGLRRDSAPYHDLVMVITVFSLIKNSDIHYIRTLTSKEVVAEVRKSLLKSLCEKYSIEDDTHIRGSIRWYHKDYRTAPIEFGDAAEVEGEYDSDEESEITHSDASYLSKAERKGYLLKRSSKDKNVWRRKFCVLTDHLWCIDISMDSPRVQCIRLGAGVAYEDEETSSQSSMPHTSGEKWKVITISSMKKTHRFRAFNILEQQKWIGDLNFRAALVGDNEVFAMADVITFDEESTKQERYHKSILNMLSVGSVSNLLLTEKDYTMSFLYDFPPHYSDGHHASTHVGGQSDKAAAGRTIENEDTRLVSVEAGRPALFLSESSRREMMATLPTIIEPVNGENDATNRQNSNDKNDVDSLEERLERSLIEEEELLESVVASIKDDNALIDSDRTHNDEVADDGKSHSLIIQQTIDSRRVAKTSQIMINDQSDLFNIHHSWNEPTLSIHRLHCRNEAVAGMMSFVANVMYYKDLFRHDLFVSIRQQNVAAMLVYTTFLLPQLRFGRERKLKRIAEKKLASIQNKNENKTEQRTTNQETNENSSVSDVSPPVSNAVSAADDSIAANASDAAEDANGKKIRFYYYNKFVTARRKRLEERQIAAQSGSKRLTSNGGVMNDNSSRNSNFDVQRNANISVVSDHHPADWGLDVKIIRRAYSGIFEVPTNLEAQSTTANYQQNASTSGISLMSDVGSTTPRGDRGISPGAYKQSAFSRTPSSLVAASAAAAASTSTPAPTASFFWPWFGNSGSTAAEGTSSPSPITQSAAAKSMGWSGRISEPLDSVAEIKTASVIDKNALDVKAKSKSPYEANSVQADALGNSNENSNGKNNGAHKNNGTVSGEDGKSSNPDDANTASAVGKQAEEEDDDEEESVDNMRGSPGPKQMLYLSRNNSLSPPVNIFDDIVSEILSILKTIHF